MLPARSADLTENSLNVTIIGSVKVEPGTLVLFQLVEVKSIRTLQGWRGARRVTKTVARGLLAL